MSGLGRDLGQVLQGLCKTLAGRSTRRPQDRTAPARRPRTRSRFEPEPSPPDRPNPPVTTHLLVVPPCPTRLPAQRRQGAQEGALDTCAPPRLEEVADLGDHRPRHEDWAADKGEGWWSGRRKCRSPRHPGPARRRAGRYRRGSLIAAEPFGQDVLMVTAQVTATAGDRAEPGCGPGDLNGVRDGLQAPTNLAQDSGQLLVRQLIHQPPQFVPLSAHVVRIPMTTRRGA
jgi:hypothetical protein